MKMRRLVFSFITILLLFSNFGFSQHSTYQDAKDLAEMIRKKQVPKFDFSKCSSNEFTPFKPHSNILVKDGEKEPLLLSEKVKNVDYLFLDYIMIIF